MTIAPWPVIGVRSALVAAGIVAWYATQAVLGKRVPKVDHEVPLTDGIHVLTARMHARYATNVAAGNRLLIISSLSSTCSVPISSAPRFSALRSAPTSAW
jgi:hypothetical protein